MMAGAFGVVALVNVVIIIVIIMMVVMMMFFFIVIVVMMAGAFGVVALVVIIVIMMVVMVVMMFFLGSFREAGEFFLDGVAALHGLHQLFAVQKVPRGGDDDGRGVVFLQQGDGFLQLFLADCLGMREDDATGVFHLVVEEFAEIFHIELALVRVDDGGKTVQDRAIRSDVLHRADDVRELAHARRLDQDAVGAVLVQHLAQRSAEIADQRTADAPAVHLVDADAGVLKEASVDPDLAELVFDENDLFAGVSLFEQFFDERGLSRAEKSGENVDLCHLQSSLFFEDSGVPKVGAPSVQHSIIYPF